MPICIPVCQSTECNPNFQWVISAFEIKDMIVVSPTCQVATYSHIFLFPAVVTILGGPNVTDVKDGVSKEK